MINLLLHYYKRMQGDIWELQFFPGADVEPVGKIIENSIGVSVVCNTTMATITIATSKILEFDPLCMKDGEVTCQLGEPLPSNKKVSFPQDQVISVTKNNKEQMGISTYS